MKTRKVLSLVLALILVIGVLAGCSGGNVKTSAKPESFKHTDEKLELSWLGYAQLTGCSEGTASEKLLEKTFNVEIKPIFLEGATYQDKKSAMLAAGDVPDLIYELDPVHVYKDVEDEYLFEVQYEVIKEHAPKLYASINDKAKAVWSYAYYDGKNWGIPNINHSHMVSKQPIYRKDWLEAVDKEIPTTVDELHDVLLAFKNANLGKGATYGYTMYESHYQYYFGEIFGAYGVLPFDWQEVDGEIVYGGLRPEVETVLGILQNWYKEGIIYPAYAEGNPDKSATKLLGASQLGYNNFFGYVDPNGISNTLLPSTQKVDPKAEFISGQPIKGPEGEYGMRGWGYPCHVVSFGAVDETGESTPKKITRMLEMFEGMYTDNDLLMEVRYGKEGEQYEVNYETTQANAFVPLGKYTDYAERRLNGYEFSISGPSFWSPFAPSEELYNSSFTNAYKAYLDEYQDEKAVLYDVFYKVDIVPSATQYLEVLRTEQIKLMNQIIMGQSNIKPDQFCEEFDKIWKANGGEQMLSEAKDQKKVNDEIIKQLP